MKKAITLILLLAAGTTFAANADKSYVTTATVTLNGTNAPSAQLVSPSPIEINEWVSLDYAKVRVPPNETGTVAIAQSVFGIYSAVTTLYVTNDTAAYLIVDTDIADPPITGPMTLTYSKTGTATNGWRTVLLFK